LEEVLMDCFNLGILVQLLFRQQLLQVPPHLNLELLVPQLTSYLGEPTL
jgi:hypothetical protein